MKKIAVITGASSGLGEEFVRQLGASEADEIWAVARRKDRLERLRDITDIPVRVISVDLCEKSSIDLIKNMLLQEKPHVHLLVNAAGFGRIGSYDEISEEDVDRMIDLNCKAAVNMTYACLPYMLEGDHIMEISSTSAFQPLSDLNIYASTKAFLYHFSRALRRELKNRGIYVTVVCPYWIKDTEFIPVAKMTQGEQAKVNSFPFASKKKDVVRKAYSDTYKGCAVSTPGMICTLHHFMTKFTPAEISLAVWERIK